MAELAEQFGKFMELKKPVTYIRNGLGDWYTCLLYPGMEPTNNLSEQVIREQGKAGFFGNVHTEMGYNWRMSEVHAAIGLSQFARLEAFIADRRRTAKIYDEDLKKVDGITLIKIPSEVKSNYYKYVAMLDEGIDRADLKKELKEKYDVSLSGGVYELPCHLQPIFKDLYGFTGGEFPVAEDVCKRQICLPVFATMTEEQAKYVIDSLKDVLK